jgi:plastocyanin
MKRKMIILKLGLGIFVLAAIALSYAAVSQAQECRVVRLHGSAGGSPSQIYIEPRTVRVSEGACVVWVNWIIGPIVDLRFDDGKTCKSGTAAATPGWALDLEKNCFVTNLIPQGGTASLSFQEKGVYDFVVETKQGGKSSGKIVVE